MTTTTSPSLRLPPPSSQNASSNQGLLLTSAVTTTILAYYDHHTGSSTTYTYNSKHHCTAPTAAHQFRCFVFFGSGKNPNCHGETQKMSDSTTDHQTTHRTSDDPINTIDICVDWEEAAKQDRLPGKVGAILTW
ncbi:hypothetical protein L1887_00772 [Cichorium endivia]|nr:hypothetical protein L1887_00772 [Cichorium endivia]